jgi:hypothetical protein
VKNVRNSIAGVPNEEVKEKLESAAENLSVPADRNTQPALEKHKPAGPTGWLPNVINEGIRQFQNATAQREQAAAAFRRGNPIRRRRKRGR